MLDAAHEEASAPSRPRLVIIGIDSSTFRILRPLVNGGDLPTFGALMDRGAHGVLLSTIPSVTPPGWVTSYTGVNPGKHNVFDFKDHTRYVEAELPYEMASTTSRSMRADPFWRILNRHGLSTGLFNLPMTYPVEPVDGFMLAGFPCGTDEEGLYHPPGVWEEVRSVAPDFTVYVRPVDIDDGRPGRYLDHVNRVARAQARAAVDLLRHRPVDVLMLAFTEVDRVQHYFWASWDEGHPTHDADKVRFRYAFRDHYQVIDRGIGDLLDVAGPDVPVLVYSDHGSGTLFRHFFPNTYLVKEGIIVLKGAREGPPDVREGPLDRRRIARALKRLGLEGLIRYIPRAIRRSLPTVSMETVDWSRTRAYFSSMGAKAVTINLRGREPEGCVGPGDEYDRVVTEVVGALRGMRDPGTGNPPIEEVYRRDELYEGPYVENAPDIIIVPAEGYMPFREFEEDVYRDPGSDWRDRSSEHERQGIVLLAGPGIRRGLEMGEHHIADIAPTVLHLCGVPVPDHMDGRVMEDALDEEWLARHPVRFVESEGMAEPPEGGVAMTPEEEELLKDRLRSLGYMG